MKFLFVGVPDIIGTPYLIFAFFGIPDIIETLSLICDVISLGVPDIIGAPSLTLVSLGVSGISYMNPINRVSYTSSTSVLGCCS